MQIGSILHVKDTTLYELYDDVSIFAVALKVAEILTI